MNIELINLELDKAWQKVGMLPGQVEVLDPSQLEPHIAATTIISLLEATYSHHALSHHPSLLEEDIASGLILPWIVTRDNVPIACATLINQPDGSKELGRAASRENGSGAGKIAMLESAKKAATLGDQLVAEVRLADDFEGIPSGMATQKICFEMLGLVPHAFVPAFSHGVPLRHEMFAFSTDGFALPPDGRVTTAANQTFKERLGARLTDTRRLHIGQEQPLRVATINDNGLGIHDFVEQSRLPGNGCTLVPIEVVDENISTIEELLSNDFIAVGLDRNQSSSGLPVVLLTTLAHDVILAPTKASHVLTRALQDDIALVQSQFQQILRRG